MHGCIRARPDEFASEMTVGFGFRLAIHANDLLSRIVRHARENAGLGDGCIRAVLENAADGNVLLAERLDEQTSGFVVADRADGKNVDAEIGEVADGVGAAAGDELSLAVFEDENGSFAGDAGDFSEDEFISDQIAEDCYGDIGERLDELAQAVSFFEVPGHWGSSILAGRAQRTQVFLRDIGSATNAGDSTRVSC